MRWFEEPVTSDDLDGLRALREGLPLDVTAGEYGYQLEYFRDMLRGGAVDVLQADIGRCAGVTEWLRVGATCAAFSTPLSAHCGPSLHAHAATAAPNLRPHRVLPRPRPHRPPAVRRRPRARRRSAAARRRLPGLGLSLRRDDVAAYRVA